MNDKKKILIMATHEVSTKDKKLKESNELVQASNELIDIYFDTTLEKLKDYHPQDITTIMLNSAINHTTTCMANLIANTTVTFDELFPVICHRIQQNYEEIIVNGGESKDAS
jgi:hypothetical protein